MFRSSVLRRAVTGVTVTLMMVTGVPSANAGAASVTASSGSLTARFTYTGSFPQAKNPRLVISEAGKVLYDEPVSSKWCGHRCWPLALIPHAKVLNVVHLQSSGPASVVLGLYSGGAHCCSIEQVFSLGAGSSTIEKAEYDFGDPGVRLVPIGPGGSFEFLSENSVFAYAFTDYAASGMPIKILSFSHNQFNDVTRSFATLVARDATRWLKAFNLMARSHYQDSVGLVAAWAADEEMLGHSSIVSSFLAKEAAAGHLNSALSPEEPSGHRFVAALEKFLHRYGYLK